MISMLNKIISNMVSSRDFVPNKIIDRDEQKETITEWLNSELKRNLLITSTESGTGKTSLIRWFFQNEVPEEIIPVYVLSRDTGTNYLTLKAICDIIEDRIKIQVKDKKSHYGLVTYLRDILKNKEVKMIICLDEVDFILDREKNDELLNTLLHIQRECEGTLQFIFISNDYLIKRRMSYITLSRLNSMDISFSKYFVNEGVNILKYYIYDVKMIRKEYLPERKELTEKLTKFVKLLSIGDMRRILQYFIIWVEDCTKHGKFRTSILNDTFFDKIMKNETLDVVKRLNEQEKMILLSLIKSNIDAKDFTDKRGKDRRIPEKFYRTDIKRFYSYYNGLCEACKIPTLQLRQFKFYLYELVDKKRLVHIQRTSEGRGKGVVGYYFTTENVNDYMENIINRLIFETGISEEFMFNTNIASKLLVR